MNKRSARSSSAGVDDRYDGSADLQTNPRSLFGKELSRKVEPESFRTPGGQAVVVVSADGSIVEVLQAPEIADGAAPSSLIGAPVDELWPGEPAGRLAAMVKRAIRSRQVQSSEFGTDRDDAHYDFIFIPHGRDRAMLVARDVSARKTAFSRMERLAYLDDTTKLPNRQFLCEELARCTEMLRLQEGRAAVLCFDVSSGEAQGAALDSKQHDVIFIELASRLTHELRGANQFDADDYERYSVAARIEHRQFGVFLPVIDSGADAEGVAQRLIETLQQPIKLAHREIRVTARAGIALFPQDGTDADTLYANAVTAMEDARNNHSTAYKFHSGTVRLRALQRQDLELELRAALEKDEFAVEFLPIVGATNRVVTAVEALLRWPQNVFGSQSIKKVVSIAENTGLILPIGDWVLRKSCEALKEWHAGGSPELRISVNLSVAEFSREDLADRLVRILAEHAIEPGFLDLEISEYSLFRDAMRSYSMCRGLKELGVGVVVDDYGTGACSLAHVARSPVDAIKIDNSFVANADSDSDDQAACAAIAAMAKTLGKKIIAEGVETEAQARVLAEQGCDYLQGFLICRPTSVEGIRAYVNRNSQGAGG